MVAKTTDGGRLFGHRYPWEEWFARGKFHLRRGRDYRCQTTSIAIMVRLAAGRDRLNYEVRITTDPDGDGVRVEARPREE